MTKRVSQKLEPLARTLSSPGRNLSPVTAGSPPSRARPREQRLQREPRRDWPRRYVAWLPAPAAGLGHNALNASARPITSAHPIRLYQRKPIGVSLKHAITTASASSAATNTDVPPTRFR